MAKKRCPHSRVYRERGPRVARALVNDIDDEGRTVVEVSGPVVVEVCERCGRRREIPFRKEPG